jgi:CubicO group peptidase (beta-lactamase class C family)
MLMPILLPVLFSCSAGGPVVPGKHWEAVDHPEDLGYSSARLAEAEEFSKGLKTAAVIIVVDGRILYEWGEVEKKFKTHSIRKSVLSALYGNYVKEGVIDLDLTLAELGIDDEPPLSGEERNATVRDCLKARSGIYHTALYESPRMKALKPERHSGKAGTHWYYNNWDFNAAGTIFEILTGKNIFEAIQVDIAEPTDMEDYTAADGWYVTGEESIHPAYPFRITARDLARFGLLMLNKGNWDGRQVIPEDWVEESTSYHSDATLYGCDGYAYMWWVKRDHNKFTHLPNLHLNEGSYSARGYGGHYLLIIPGRNMVIVHRVNTDIEGHRVTEEEFGKLVTMILNSTIES